MDFKRNDDSQDATGAHGLGQGPIKDVDVAEMDNITAETPENVRTWAEPDNSVTIPCEHIRLGDILIFDGRPCQVIRISTSSATGQHRYLGADVFTHQLREEISTIHNPTPGVVVQTMRGPIAKQYRLLDIQGGRFLCMTETGDKKWLPVRKAPGLAERASQDLDAGQGSVRVLVVHSEGQEMVVDVKTLHETTISWDDLYTAARGGDLDQLRKVLKVIKLEEIDRPDKDGKTALIHAVENRKIQAAYKLISAKASVNAMDNFGMTVLDRFLDQAKPGLETTSFLEFLLDNNVSIAKCEKVTQLLLASATGKTDEVKTLLENEGEETLQSLLNGTDRLGYTALHEAALHGHDSIVEILIKKEANLEAAIHPALGGDNAIHCIVERYTHQSYIQRDPTRVGYHGNRNRDTIMGENSSRYTQGHSRLITMLLDKRKSLIHHKRTSDHLTVQGVVLRRLISVDLSEAARYTLEQILMILRCYTPTGMQFQISLTPKSALFDERAILGPNSSRKLLYRANSKSENPRVLYMEDLPQIPGGLSETKSLRWAQIPRNSKNWVEDVIGCLSDLDEDALKRYMSGCKAFISETYDEVRVPRHHPGMRKPSFSAFSPQYAGVFSLVIPYFDAVNLNCLGTSQSGARICTHEHCDANQRDKRSLKEIYTRPGEQVRTWQEPCTLDQSCYVFLDARDSAGRNKEQVVAKQSGQDENDKTILMVNQMWIWKIDCRVANKFRTQETIITAWPGGTHNDTTRGATPNLPTRIYEALEQRSVSNTESMILRMMQTAIESFNLLAKTGFPEDVLDIFDKSIVLQKHRESECYENFHNAQSMEIKEEEMCNITQEMKTLRQIRDIQDELNMIQRVFRDQGLVMRDYSDAVGNLLSSEDDALESMKVFFKRSSLRISDLLSEANSVEKSLNDLLDIKQKHGNLTVTRNMRRLANQADDRAKDDEWQSQLLFIFTVVTVIFTPLSLVFGFFAVPSRDFPADGQGNIAWTWWEILVGSLATEVATVVAIMLFWRLTNTLKLRLKSLTAGDSDRTKH